MDFLTTTAKQGYLNENTALGRRTACAKLFAVLEEPEQKTVSYVLANIDIIKARFQNLNKDIRGGTIDVYANRVIFACNDYLKWVGDRGAWERDAAGRGKSSSNDGDRKYKAAKHDKLSHTPAAAVAATPSPQNANTRIVSIPIREDFEVTFVVPKDLKINEVRKIAYVLAGYVVDYDPTASKALQNLLDFKGNNPGVSNS